jgi:hypothetical protein
VPSHVRPSATGPARSRWCARRATTSASRCGAMRLASFV